MEQLSFHPSKFKLSEVNSQKCVKSQSEQADGAIFDKSVGIVLLRDCTTGSVAQARFLPFMWTPLIKRTILCWVIGSLGLL